MNRHGDLPFFWRAFIALDQFLQVWLSLPLRIVFGIKGWGDPDQTISGVLGLSIYNGTATRRVLWLDWLLSKIDPKTTPDRPSHCLNSIEWDRVK